MSSQEDGESPVKWKCKYKDCTGEIPGVPASAVLPNCPFCKKSQVEDDSKGDHVSGSKSSTAIQGIDKVDNSGPMKEVVELERDPPSQQPCLEAASEAQPNTPTLPTSDHVAEGAPGSSPQSSAMLTAPPVSPPVAAQVYAPIEVVAHPLMQEPGSNQHSSAPIPGQSSEETDQRTDSKQSQLLETTPDQRFTDEAAGKITDSAGDASPTGTAKHEPAHCCDKDSDSGGSEQAVAEGKSNHELEDLYEHLSSSVSEQSMQPEGPRDSALLQNGQSTGHAPRVRSKAPGSRIPVPALRAPAGSRSLLKPPMESRSSAKKKTASPECRSKPRIEYTMDGIRSSDENAVAITFNVILPRKFWPWDKDCKLALRFGNKKLGLWEENVGTFEKHRTFDEDYIWMQCNLNIDFTLLSANKSIAYKYVVKWKDEVWYEFLHDSPQSSEGFNRCLQVPLERCHAKSKYYRYDGMIFPELKSESLMRRIGSRLFQMAHYFRSQLEQEEVKEVKDSDNEKMPKPLPYDEAQERCLDFFTYTYQKKLIDVDLSKIKFSEMVSDFLRIYRQLYRQTLCIGNSRNGERIATSLPKAFEILLFGVADRLQRHEITSSGDNGKRISCVFVVLTLLKKIDEKLEACDKDPKEYMRLFSMLYLKPEFGCNPPKPSDLNFVMHTFIPDTNDQRNVANTLVHFVDQVLKSNVSEEIEWMYMVPWIHFLRKRVKPFETATPDIIWEDRDVDFTPLKERQFSAARFSMAVSDKLQPLIQLDPLLLPQLVYICPTHQISSLFAVIPPSVSASWLHYSLVPETGDPLCVPDHCVLVDALLPIIKQLSQSEEMNVIYNKVKETFKIASCCHEKDTSYFHKIVSLFLHTAAKYIEYPSKEVSSEPTEMLKEVEQNISLVWIPSLFPLGFGKVYMDKCLQKEPAKRELEIFQGLATADTPVMFREHWISMLHDILKNRVEGIDSKVKIELIEVLESMDEPHEFVKNLLIDAVVRSFEEGGNKLQQLHRSSVKYRGLVGKVVVKLLDKRFPSIQRSAYPSGSFAIPLKELLEWEFWPVCITIYRTEQKETTLHPSNYHGKMCALADQMLMVTMNGIMKRTVSVNNLTVIEKRRQQFLNLCSANQEEHQFESVKTNLDDRLSEVDTFKRHLECLRRLCSGIQHSSLQIEGMLDLSKKVRSEDKDLYLKNVESLCCMKDGQIEYIGLQLARPLVPILDQYYCLSHEFENRIFEKLLASELDRMGEASAKLSITDVVSEVWKPIYGKCRKLVDDMYSGEIQLKYLEDCFQDVLEDSMYDQLHKFCRAIQACEGEAHSFDWIKGVIEKFQLYQCLCSQAEVAKNVVEIKKFFKLSEGFDFIEKVSTKDVGACLNDMDEKKNQAKAFLGQFTGERLDFLQVFVTCFRLVRWIRQLGKKGISDLHNFVSNALHMAVAEGAYSSDRLSHLKTVASGLKPLIYDLKAGSDLAIFEKCCSEVWKAIEADTSLTTYLKSCNEHLEWYKSVKGNQGTIEETSYGQMNNIFQFGCYFVGSEKAHICHNYSEVIVLKLKKAKAITKTEYKLEELRDLESKLVLITGSKAKCRDSVDIFIDVFHSVCRIAEVLLELQQAGNVKYTGWKLLVPCSEKKDCVSMLQAEAKKMEQELSLWRKTVGSKREEFYELNYYTTSQLLTLRKKLISVMKTSKATISPDVLALLHSISDNVTAADVSTAVRGVVRGKLCVIPSTGDTVATDRDGYSASMRSSQKESLNEGNEAPTDMHQREIIADIRSRLHCSEELVIRSFRECPGKEKNRLDYEKWCKEMIAKQMEGLTEEQREDVDAISYELHCSVELVIRSFHECPASITTENRRQWCNEELFEEEDEFSLDSDSSESGSESDKEDVVSLEAIPEKVIVSPSVQSSDIAPETADSERVREPNHPNVTLLGFFKKTFQAVTRHPKKEDQKYLDSTEGHGAVANSVEQLTTDECPATEEDGVTGVGHLYDSSWVCGDDPTVYLDEKAEQKYLKLEQLGKVLSYLSGRLPVKLKSKRSFPKYLTEGSPNLLVVPRNDILKTALTLYMEEYEHHPLPTPEEVLICTSSTTAEEIQLFWMTAINDPGYKRIFCMVHAEKLSYRVSDQALTSLQVLTQGKKDYRLVLICSSQDEVKSHFIAKLHLSRRFYVSQDAAKCKSYLTSKFLFERGSQASMIDHENFCVRIISSCRSGMGKSLYILRLAENLQKKLKTSKPVHATIPLHGPVVTPDTILDLFEEHWNKPTSYIYHIDVASNILWQVDTILFSLLILRGLTDSKGRVWCCHPDQLYVIEVTTQIDDFRKNENQTLTLLDMLPCFSCLGPRESVKQPDKSLHLMDDSEFQSHSYQRVYQYLHRHFAGSNLDEYSFTGKSEGSPQECLKHLLRCCGVKDPSWSEIRHFVKFLDYQLESCEKSVFTKSKFTGDVMKGLKSFVVKFMIPMSRDFSTSSLCMEIALEMKESFRGDHVEQYQISQRKRWEQSSHPYIFFNQDRDSFTFVGFTVDQKGDLLHPTDKKRVLERAIMTPGLYAGLKHNGVNFQDDYRMWSKATMIEKISAVMGVDPYDPDESYVLTSDNIVKILAIQMRFRCSIPVVIMGETGCGKTRLIRYMCDLARQGKDQNNMFILKVHGGTSEGDIVDFIQRAEKVSGRNRDSGLDTVVFFDEANTTDAIGLIKEIMCDRRINGKPVSEGLKFIAACNPYKKHDEKMVERLDSAGLGFFVKTTETQERLGKIPLRHLVYRVLDLPPSMRPLVYDFGQLSVDTEEHYIAQIVKDHILKILKPRRQLNSDQISESIATILSKSQQYMRATKDECSYVSLRDVERAMIVFEYMYRMMDRLGPLIDKWANENHEDPMNVDDDTSQLSDDNKAGIRDDSDKPDAIDDGVHGTEDGDGEVGCEDSVPCLDHCDAKDYVPPDRIARALILSLSVCYHARLQKREDYEKLIVSHFTGHLFLTGGCEQFRNEIKWCQEVLLDNMFIGDNIARNAALRENVFMMAVCIELRIPLFLVGKPGSSKSLAKSIVSESMKGKDARNSLLKEFKDVEIFSYQCSQLSTSESIIGVFNTASEFQGKQGASSVAVVVLDEVGLAEDSPNLPLKALHPLLEDGTEGAKKGYIDEIKPRQERVAFIGISNWALDPAKMNRGVMVTRDDPGVKELILSARGICSNEKNDPIREILQPYFKCLAEAYISICSKQEREFFGLRDFYSLIKMLYYMCKKSKLPPTNAQLEHAIKRNFGGLESEKLHPYQEFFKRLPKADTVTIMEKHDPILNPDCSRLGLIKSSLNFREHNPQGENRYVLFLTENYAALEVLKNNFLSTNKDQKPPFIIFGSSFPKDRDYTQVCRIINQIKICMETGCTVILLNLENLYESLYDLLNQYFIVWGTTKYVDLGLQTHRVRCRVEDTFKLILIAEKATVYKKFPTPLINRMEKHFVLTSSILKGWQDKVLRRLEDWLDKFVDTRNSNFKLRDAFIGFQKDTPASVVLQASNMLLAACSELKRKLPGAEEKWSDIMRWSQARPEDLIEKDGDFSLPEKPVFFLSKFLMLETAAPDAIVRLERSALADEKEEIMLLYFLEQHHSSLIDFLTHHIQRTHSGECGLLMQVTTHSHLLSQKELNIVQSTADIQVFSFFLHVFDTELDFSNKVSPLFVFNDDEDVSSDRLVIIQCDSHHAMGDLIACARYRVLEFKTKAGRSSSKQVTHVLFVIYLPQHSVDSSLVGFQGDPWISSHIDDLRMSADASIITSEAILLSISELFCPMKDDVCFQDAGEDSTGSADEENECSSKALTMKQRMFASRRTLVRHPLYRCLHNCLHQAVSNPLDLSTKRTIRRAQILVRLIPKEPPLSLGQDSFHGILVQHVYAILQEYDEDRVDEKEWVINEAMNPKNLQHGGTFSNALSRKVTRVVIPIFSEIIARIDKNYNLDLIDPKEEETHISQFWLKVFMDSRIMQFSYADLTTGRDLVSGIGVKVVKDFQCRLPFSWLIYEAVMSQWHNATSSSSGDEVSQIKEQLCILLKTTAIGNVISNTKSTHQDFYKRYLHDFVRFIHQCNHRNSDHKAQEYELISAALDALVHGDLFRSTKNLLHKIAALYVVYKTNESQILWFGQLVSLSPGVLIHLQEENIRGRQESKTEMVLHLRSAMRIMDKLMLQRDPAVNLVPWLNEVRLFKGVVTSIINLPSQDKLSTESRVRWDGITLLQLFVEHILLRHLSFVPFLNRLKLYLDSSPDFLQVATIERIQKHLNALKMETKRHIKDKKELKSFKSHCHEYFIEVVATLCFGGQQAPEAALVEMLMNVVFTKDTEKVSFLKDGRSDKVSVVKSSLLQLLLEHNSASVKQYYEQYFDRSRKALQQEGEDQGLCLLFIQCFEDALHKKWAGQLLDIKGILEKSYQALKKYKADQDVIIVHYLEGIAGVRFAMMEVANLLHSHYESRSDQQLDLSLMQLAEQVCSDPAINTVDFGDRGNGVVGPAMYLLKLLARLYGFSCLKQAIKDYHWILPGGLQSAAEQGKVIDPFVMYRGKIRYTSMRDLIDATLLQRKVDALNKAAQLYDVDEAAVLLLAMYEVITLSYAQTQTQTLDAALLDELNRFVQSVQSFSLEMQQMAQLLLTNKQGGVLGQMCISPKLSAENKSLGAIVIHSVVVISCNPGENILQPFLHMLTKPAALADLYLPTMAQDNLLEIQQIVVGKSRTLLYECPKGHPYFIGNCGQAVYEGTCNVCGCKIGGKDCKLEPRNKRGRDKDITQSGHILGDPGTVSGPPVPERSLSPPAICIVRAIMHSAFLWFSCHHTEMYGKLAAIVKPKVPQSSLPKFFWRHLKKDIEQLSRATGKSPDESAIIVHLVLQNMLLKAPPTFDGFLNTKEGREEWEREFCKCYIHPVLAKLDQQLAVSMDFVAKDEKHDPGQIFCVAYEKLKVRANSVEPHLWSYRQRISLEHLGQTLQEEELKRKYPILFEFLRLETSLRATQYLPDIVRLQRSLHDAYHHRLHRRDAMTMTIDSFIGSIKNESARQKCEEQIESLNKAWILVGVKLKTQSRFRLKDEDFLPAITGDTPLEYLIPTASGAGVLTTALVDYLILAHNEFITRCCNVERDSGWIKHEVPITHIHRCHLLDYERQIVSMVLSHCCYSLKVGEAHSVLYDHQALEKHLLDRFIYGKPIIQSDIPQVAYRNDMYTTFAFNVVRRKVNPQERLDSQTKKEILAELRTPDRIRENLDVVDIVLGFLSSGGGKPDKPLGEYVDKVLKMKKKSFSTKAHDSCRLCHILSLWETLSVELAKMTWLHQQEPFDALDKKYLSPLNDKDGKNQVDDLKDCLRSFDLDKLLGALFEFIETYVKYSPDNGLEWAVTDVLAEDMFSHLDLDPQFFDKFPASITLDQTVAAWKHIVVYQDKLMQD